MHSPQLLDRRPSASAVDSLIERYLSWIAAVGYAPDTLRARRRYLRHFSHWLKERGTRSVLELDRERLEDYQICVAQRRRADGRACGAGALTQRLLAVKGFLRWASHRTRVPSSLPDHVTLPRPAESLPRGVLTAAQVEHVLALPRLSTPLGLRDRALLETLYATGIRRAEIARLELGDVDPARQVVWIRHGKGRRDRVVPIAHRALGWIDRYLVTSRQRLAQGRGAGTLFLTVRGNPWRPKDLSERVRTYLRRAGFPQVGSCHAFRHTMATLMLENGADIRFLQVLLGHARLSTTAIYTRIALSALRAVYERTHPAAAGVESGVNTCDILPVFPSSDTTEDARNTA